MPYKILPYSFNKAIKHNVEITRSSNPLKKIDVFKNDKKIASIGGIKKDGKPYGDYPTYKKYKGNKIAYEKRKAYLKRHAHEPKWKVVKGKKVRTPSYYADVLLW